ncbi:MAG: PQ-loop domain-containing transporter [Bacteroidia bacterium]
MTKIISIIRNYRIREVEHLQILIFWMTLIAASISLFYLIWKL